jgi:DNA-binding response OmpR family regulator
MQILVVDDHREVRDLLVRALGRDGHRVQASGTLAEARALLATWTPDVIVLDLGLPDGDGEELCRELRRSERGVPILMLTAHGEVSRRVAGLEAGADDFLAKPFAVAELRARVRALGRRGPLTRPAVVRIGEVELDLAARRARKEGREVPITAREWAVLELLASRAGRVVSRTAILEAVWGDDGDAASASLDVIVGRIRRKLGTFVVRTVRGEGYALGDRDA